VGCIGVVFFCGCSKRERLVAAENVALTLKNPIVKLYFQFLDYVLRVFTKFNRLFQSEYPNLHRLTRELVSLYKSFLSCYMTNAYIKSTPISELDPTSKEHMVSLTAMSMGHHVASGLAKPEILARKAEVRGFLEHCQLFFIEAAVLVKQRFPISDQILSSLTFLDPSSLSSAQCSAIVNVASKFQTLLQMTYTNSIVSGVNLIFHLMTPRRLMDRYWGDIAALTDGYGEIKFPTLGYFVKSLLSLPHSNADVERIFSHQN